MSRAPLSVSAIQDLLDHCLEVEFSFIKTETPARHLARLPRADQDFILAWVKRLASTHIQLAYQFIERTISVLSALDKGIIEAWAVHAMDIYDRFGLRPALIVIQEVDDFMRQARERKQGTVLAQHARVLLHFLHGLSGRELKLEEGAQAYTDTESVFLPAVISTLETPAENFRIYKVMAAYFWAQNWFGTFRAPLMEFVTQQARPEEFQARFHRLETLRLEACLRRHLPGLYRDMQGVAQALGTAPLPLAWQEAASAVAQPGVDVYAVLRICAAQADRLPPCPPAFYQGAFSLEQVARVQAARLAQEKARFRHALYKLQSELARETAPPLVADAPEFRKQIPEPGAGEQLETMEITVDDKPVPVPENVKKLMTSIIQDLGDLPDEYLVPAGPGEYDPALLGEDAIDPDEVWRGTYHEEGAFLYDEWDYQRQHYHKNWCAVREKTLEPTYDGFVTTTLHKYHGVIKHLRRTFEALRDEDRLLKRQFYGDDVDIDALVEALADTHDGGEMSERLFTRMHRTERNIAVCLMVDMSGSTKGWINLAEREALILLAETLETLGDQYAIYGFSGMARKRCEIYKIKGFDEPYNELVRGRISAVEPKDYTRMGFAIRHLTQVLRAVEARTRILITLSDGKPDDYDSYRGRYGIEDTRRALIEARYAGIHPYCVTIDQEGRDYLPYMYGPAAFNVIDDVAKLPLKISDIYRRLTL